MAADVKKNDDFSKGPISKTVLRLAVPMVLAQFVNVLYNIVDRMYIGHISDTSVDALTGVGVTFPILLMVTAFANLFGSGGTPLFSMARGAAQQGGEEGEKQRERAADVLMILTDIDGVYDKNPKAYPDAKRLSVIEKIDDEVRAMAGGAGSARGTGGMATKIRAAEIAGRANIPTYILSGEDPENLYRIFDGEDIGTVFMP